MQPKNKILNLKDGMIEMKIKSFNSLNKETNLLILELEKILELKKNIDNQLIEFNSNKINVRSNIISNLNTNQCLIIKEGWERMNYLKNELYKVNICLQGL